MPVGEDEDRMRALEARLELLETSVRELRAELTSAAPAQAAPIPQSRQTAAAPALAQPQSIARRPEIDAEAFFGGRVLLAAGAVVLVLGVAFFLKYAFDNGWIGPTGRVAIGLLGGLGLAILGERLQRRSSVAFAGAMTGLGGAILYLSLWAAGNGFHLIPLAASGVAMIVVTAGLLGLAVRRSSEITAGFALLGGFITPLLVASSAPSALVLFIYIALLDGALSFLPGAGRWRWVNIGAFVLTQLYLLGSSPAAGIGEAAASPATFLGFATLYFALFAWRPIRAALAKREVDSAEVIPIASTAVFYYVALHLQFYGQHRIWLVASVAGLAALYLGLARLAAGKGRTVLASVSLALVTGGVAIAFSGAALAAIWAVEGALLCVAGLRRSHPLLRACGYGAFLLGLGYVTSDPPSGGHGLLNPRFAVFAIFAVSLLAVRIAGLRAKPSDWPPESSIVLPGIEIGGHLCALYALSTDLYDARGELSVTLLWLLYATALFVAGLRWRSAFTRWEAIALLGCALVKAFVVDLAAVDPGVRIITFLALGTVLLGVSYFYQRRRKSEEHTP